MIFAISGATGLIGSALVKEALKRGDGVIAFVRSAERAREIESAGAKIVELDLAEFGGFQPEPYLKADVFVHLGWDKTSISSRDDTDAQARNVIYTLAAVGLACRLGARAFVGAGSQAEFGVKSAPLTCETPCAPESAYGAAKYAAGRLSLIKAQKAGLRWNWARILSVYGENDAPTTLISYLIASFLKGETPKLTECGQTWDYLYAEDCARALYAIAERGADGKAYPVGSGKPRLLKEYVETVRNAVNPDAEIEFGAKSYYPHQPMHLVADISELKADTGFEPQVSFEDGIKRTVEVIKKKTAL